MTNQELLRAVQCSFPKLEPESDGFLPEKITKQQLADLRDDLSKFYPEDIPAPLGAVLFSSIQNPATNTTDGWQLERLIYFLNVNIDEPYVAGSDAGRSENEIGAELEHRRQRQKDLSVLSEEQKRTVHAWLIVALNCSHLQMLRAEIEDALRFWTKAAHTTE